jgi:xanthine dehydrogenase large subunit
MLSPRRMQRESDRRRPAHDSAHLHVSGRALYADDIPLPADALHAAFGMSSIAHGHVNRLDLGPVLKMPGVTAVCVAEDIPGENNYGSAVHDDPIFAAGTGAACRSAAVCGGRDSYQRGAARPRAARRWNTQRCRPSSTSAPRWRRKAMCCPAAAWCGAVPGRRWRRLRTGSAVPSASAVRIISTWKGQIAAAIPQEDGGMLVHSSTQHPSEVQQIIAHALGVAAHLVTVQCRRMGGGFGGKETQPALIAAAAAVMARATGRPVKLRLDRDTDMEMTGKRHDFHQ